MVIKLIRKELQWMTYSCDCDEKYFEELKDFLKTRIEDPYYRTRYEVLSSISFNTLCDMIDGKVEDIVYTLDDGWKESVIEFISDILREDAYYKEPYCDETDDFDEEIFTIR